MKKIIDGQLVSCAMNNESKIIRFELAVALPSRGILLHLESLDEKHGGMFTNITDCFKFSIDRQASKKEIDEAKELLAELIDSKDIGIFEDCHEFGIQYDAPRLFEELPEIEYY